MKKKALAWILALTMTLSSVSPVFAADIEIFGDSAAEMQEAAQAEANSESQGETAGQEKVVQENGNLQDNMVPATAGPEAEEDGVDVIDTEDFGAKGNESEDIADVSEIFEDGNTDIFSSREVEKNVSAVLLSDGEIPLITTETTFDVTSDAEGILKFNFNPGKTGQFEFKIYNDASLWNESGIIPRYSETISNFTISDNKRFSFKIISDGTALIGFENVKPNQTFSFKWKNCKEVERLSIAEDSKKIIETGVIKGLDSWILAIQFTIYYKDGTEETIGGGQYSEEGYSLTFLNPNAENPDYRCYLQQLGYHKDMSPELYVDVPYTDKSLDELGFPVLETGKALTKADFSELYANKFYCFSFTPKTSGKYALKISNAWCRQVVNNTTHEEINDGSVFDLVQDNTYVFVVQTENNDDFSININETKEVAGLTIKNLETIPSVIFQGFSPANLALNTRFIISYSGGTEEEVPFLWQGEAGIEQTYHVDIDWDSLNTSVPGKRKAKFYISELGKDSITCLSSDIEIKPIEDMNFPHIQAGQTYTEEKFAKWNNKWYCLFTPTETAKYLADYSNGYVSGIFDVKTGQQNGNAAFVMTEGHTYCLELNIINSDFKLKLNKVRDVESLELLNPQAIPSKVFAYDGLNCLSNTKFKITYLDGNSDEVSFNGKTAEGLWISCQMDRGDTDDNGNLKPGRRTIRFNLGNYNSNQIFALQEIEVVEDVNDLQLPNLQLETIYDEKNFSKTYGDYSAGKLSVSEDGIYHISRNIGSVYLIDNETKEYINETSAGYVLSKGRTYFLRCNTDTENWKFKILYIPVLSGDSNINVSIGSFNDARFIFKPSENGIYKIKVPKNVLKMDENGHCQTRVWVSDKDSSSWSGDLQNFVGYFRNDKTYEIHFDNLKDNINSFEVSALKKKTIKKLEITSGLENLPKEWILGAHPYNFGVDALRFRVTFDDGSTIENIKLEEEISSKEDEAYTIYTNISRPPIIDDNDEVDWPGEYKIDFWISEMFNCEPEQMPNPIAVTVKRPSEFVENTFPVLEIDKTYSSKDYKPNYMYGKQYAFFVKPQYTGSYDLGEMYEAFSEHNVYLDLIGEDGGIYGNMNNIGLEAGKTYAVIADATNEPWSFKIKGGNEIIKIAFADQNQSKKLKVIGELSNNDTIFNDVQFIITYKDATGKQQSTEPTSCNTYLENLPRIEYETANIDPEDVTKRVQPIRFYVDGIKSQSVDSWVSVESLENMADTLPEIKSGVEYTDLPDNYNSGKCFNFRPNADGTYLISFNNICLGTYAEGKKYADSWGGRFLWLEAKANTLYTIYAYSYDKEESLKVSAKKVSKISKVEVTQGKGDTIQWPDYFGEPDALKAVKCQLTTNDGQIEEIAYGENSKDFGQLRYEFLDENGNVLDNDFIFSDNSQLGKYRTRFYFEAMPEVKSDIIWCDFCLLEDMGYTNLVLNKNVKVLTPFIDFSTENTWGALFTPEKTQEYVIACSTANNIRVFDAGKDRSGECDGTWEEDGVITLLEANKTYAIIFTGENKNSEINARIAAAGAIRKLALDTEELVLVPGKTGTVIALPEPLGLKEKIEWSVNSDKFTLEPYDDSYSVKITPVKNAETTDTAILTAQVENSDIKTTCKITIANIATEVPKIGNTTSATPPTSPVIGLAVDKTINGQQSNAQKAEQDLQGIASSISEGKGTLGAKITPTSGSSQDNIQEEIQETIQNGGSIVTAVIVNKEKLDEQQAIQIENIVKNVIPSASLSVDQKLDITIDMQKRVEGNKISTIGNITELPKEKALTFTVLLTEEQRSKKMYVAYEHGGKIDIIPEGDVTQKAGIMTFRANKFSSYYLVSSDQGFTVTYENTTPSGGSDTQSGIKYGEYAEAKSPSASGYTFLGWFEKDSGEQWDFDTDQVTGDITLVGKWQYNTPVNPPVYYYTVRFDSQGGSDVASQSVTYGQKITEPAAPKKENYTFAGWYKEKTYTTAWDFAKDTVTAETTLYAKWDEVKQEPAQVTGVTYTSTTGAITLSWNKAENAEGYLIQGRTKGEKEYSWSKTIEKADTLTCKNSGLKAGTVREYIITAYRTVDGKKVYSTPSEILTAGTKPGNTSIKSISSKKGYVQVTAAKASGAEGYEYAYSAKNQWSNTKDYKLLGRVKKLTCTNKKVAAGVYAARVRAYKTVDGKRIYGKWSAVKWFEIPTGTVAAPKILKVKVNKNTVTVTLKNVKGATGYDCVLGTDHNPIKPTPYKYIKKNQKTTTIVFKKGKKGTYYVGAHAYKTTKGKKYFSKWSNQKKIVIK